MINFSFSNSQDCFRISFQIVLFTKTTINMRYTFLALSLLLTLTLAHPSNFSPNHATLQKRCPPFDPAGVKNVGNNAGKQFIGGQCLSTADCASGCCALPCGICSGPGASFQNGKQGCGFGGGSAAAAPGSGLTGSGSGASTVVAPPVPSATLGTGRSNGDGNGNRNGNSCGTN